MICQKEGQIPILSLHGWPMTSEKFGAISFPKENVVLKQACAFHRCANILTAQVLFQKKNTLFLFDRRSNKEGNGLKPNSSAFVISKLLIQKNSVAQLFLRFHP